MGTPSCSILVLIGGVTWFSPAAAPICTESLLGGGAPMWIGSAEGEPRGLGGQWEEVWMRGEPQGLMCGEVRGVFASI